MSADGKVVINLATGLEGGSTGAPPCSATEPPFASPRVSVGGSTVGT